MAIQGQWAHDLQVAPFPPVGASIKRFDGLSFKSLWKMPLSVATMNWSLGKLLAPLMIALVEPTTSASSITESGDSGCTKTAASGYIFIKSFKPFALNSSWTTQAPLHNNISAPVSFWIYLPKCWSGAQRIFSPESRKAETISRAQLLVTTQSASALTLAEVFA